MKYFVHLRHYVLFIQFRFYYCDLDHYNNLGSKWTFKDRCNWIISWHVFHFDPHIRLAYSLFPIVAQLKKKRFIYIFKWQERSLSYRTCKRIWIANYDQRWSNERRYYQSLYMWCTAKMHGIVNNRMHATRLDERIIRQSNTALLHASPFFLRDLPFSSYSMPSLTPQIEKENEKSDNLLLLLSAPKNAEDVLICIVYHTTVKNTIIAMYIFSSIIYF